MDKIKKRRRNSLMQESFPHRFSPLKRQSIMYSLIYGILNFNFLCGNAMRFLGRWQVYTVCEGSVYTLYEGSLRKVTYGCRSCV